MSNPNSRSGNPAVRAAALAEDRLLAKVQKSGMTGGASLTVADIFNTPGTAPPAPAPARQQLPPPSDVLRMMEQRLEALVRQNMADIHGLQAKGIGFDPGQIINGRIDALMLAVAQAFGPENGPAWLLQARLAFEEQMAQNLDLAKREGTKVQLAQAGSATAGDIRQLARQTGTYGGF